MNRKPILLVLFLTVTISSAFADIFMKQKMTTTSGSGKKEKTETVESTYWICEDKMKHSSPEASTIVRLDKDIALLIDDKKKSYMEVSLSTLTPTDATQEQKDAMAELPAMFGNMMKMTVTVEPTSETKIINSWNCKKYNQTIDFMGGKTQSELWATKDIKIPEELARKFTASLFAQNPALKQMAGDMMKEAGKIEGFVVYSTSESKIMGTTSSSITEVSEVTEDTPPANTYDVPEKYKKKKFE